MKRLMLYTPDMDGLGNIRRIMSLCQALMAFLPDLSILILSGTPMAHSFRIPDGIDYIKLPSLMEAEYKGSGADLLGSNIGHILKLRGEVLLCAVANFKPDVVMVDKQPIGVQGELMSTLTHLQEYLPQTKVTLILRDILDNPDTTQEVWARNSYGVAIEKYYDEISVLGSPDVFDPREEYAFSPAMKALTRFWGYIPREPGLRGRADVRKDLGITQEQPLVLVTAGVGEDGPQIFENYLRGYPGAPDAQRRHTLMIFGPEMSTESQGRLERWAAKFPRIHTLAFTNDLMSYMDAADIVVAMGGYGTVCEILTLKKRAIIIPRVQPIQEQWIRAQRMEKLGVFQVIHPDYLTPGNLMQALNARLAERRQWVEPFPTVDLNVMSRKSLTLQHLWDEQPVRSPSIRSANIEGVCRCDGSKRSDIQCSHGRIFCENQ